MKVSARNRKDVAAAAQNLRAYRDLAEETGAIGTGTPQHYLTEARHALQSALLPQPGEHSNLAAARRQRDVLRATDLLRRVAVQLSESDPQSFRQAQKAWLQAPKAHPTASEIIDDRITHWANQRTSNSRDNQAYIDKRFIDHVRTAQERITATEQTLKGVGPRPMTQVLAIEAAAQLHSIAYAQEAKHPGASLIARHPAEDFDALHNRGKPTPPAAGAAPRISKP